MPDKWQRIGACETGYGRRPGDFHWNSGPYQGAFGFAVSSWDAFRLPGYPSEAYLATPRQQYEVALAIWRRYGFSGWGCRNAELYHSVDADVMLLHQLSKWLPQSSLGPLRPVWMKQDKRAMHNDKMTRADSLLSPMPESGSWRTSFIGCDASPLTHNQRG